MKSILKGVKGQMLENGDLSALEAYAAGPVAEEPVLTEDVREEFWDAVNGGCLEPERVREARSEELGWIESADFV